MNRMGLIGLIIVVLLVILVTPAIASNPTITLNPNKGTVGTTVEVIGTNFSKNAAVTVYFNVSVIYYY